MNLVSNINSVFCFNWYVQHFSNPEAFYNNIKAVEIKILGVIIHFGVLLFWLENSSLMYMMINNNNDKKKSAGLFFSACLLTTIWHSFIREYDYVITLNIYLWSGDLVGGFNYKKAKQILTVRVCPEKQKLLHII